MDEAKVNADGTVVEGAERVHNNTYHLLPGHAHVKDPTVTIKSGSEESYIRVFLTFNNASKLKKYSRILFPYWTATMQQYGFMKRNILIKLLMR